MKYSSETVVRSSGSDRVLVIMAKAPRPGAVKTRLAPSLSPEAVTSFYCCLLEDAFEPLAAHDVVVGPTHDGCYYLVGAKASHPTLFARDGIGTSSALERLLARARALELSVGFADRFYDIDVADDLSRLAGELRLAPERAPRTARWLKEWGFVATQLRTGTGAL